jgi:hypothetical protein
MTNVTNAIHKAVDEERTSFHESSGIPSASLHEAVLRAVDEGIILIAASEILSALSCGPRHSMRLSPWPLRISKTSPGSSPVVERPWMFPLRGNPYGER